MTSDNPAHGYRVNMTRGVIHNLQNSEVDGDVIHIAGTRLRGVDVDLNWRGHVRRRNSL